MAGNAAERFMASVVAVFLPSSVEVCGPNTKERTNWA